MLGQSFPELQEALKGEKRTVDVNGLGKQVSLISSQLRPLYVEYR